MPDCEGVDLASIRRDQVYIQNPCPGVNERDQVFPTDRIDQRRTCAVKDPRILLHKRFGLLYLPAAMPASFVYVAPPAGISIGTRRLYSK